MRASLIALTLWPALTLSPADARAEPARLVAFDLCAGMDGREGVDCGEAFDAGGEAVYAVLKVRSAPGAIELVWRHDGAVVQRQRLQIKALRADGYRTWARQRLGAHRRGAWSLAVTTADGQQLAERRFTVGAGLGGADAAGEADADGAADETADTVEARTGVAVEQDPEDAPEADAQTDAQADAQADAGDAAADATVEADAMPGDAMPGDAIVAADAMPGDATLAADAMPGDAMPGDATPGDAIAPMAPAPEGATGRDPSGAPTAASSPRSEATSPDPEAAPDDGRRRLGAVWLFLGGALMLLAGVLLVRRRAAGRAAAAPTSAAAAGPAAAVAASDPAAEVLPALAAAVTSLWTAWWTATDGDPQGCLNRAFRAVPDATRLALDHIAACNGLEDAAAQYAIAPDGTAAEVLHARLYAQTPALLSVVCALPVEIERLGLRGSELPEALDAWGGAQGAEARLFDMLDRAAAALGVERLPLVPYETKATTAKSALGAELKPFILSESLVEQLGAGSRVVRVDTAPFTPGPTPVVRGFVGSG